MKRGNSRWLAALVSVALLAGCHRHVATAGDCRVILDRLVEMELKESGYRDPSLVPRWQEELARRFDDDLRHCQTIQVGDDLMACVRAARNPEDIAHQCVK